MTVFTDLEVMLSLMLLLNRGCGLGLYNGIKRAGSYRVAVRECGSISRCNRIGASSYQRWQPHLCDCLHGAFRCYQHGDPLRQSQQQV